MAESALASDPALDAKIAQDRAALQKSISGMKTGEIPPPPAELPTPAAPSAEMPQQAKDSLHEWGLLALGMALLGGGSAGAVTSATSALAGAVHGLNEGNQLRFNEEMSRWQKEVATALAHNRDAQNEYRSLLASRDLSLKGKIAEINVRALMLKDDVMAKTAETGNALKIAELLQKRDQFNRNFAQKSKQIQNEASTLAEKKREDAAKDAARVPPHELTDTQLTPAAWTYLFTGKIPYLGMGSQGGTRQRIIALAEKIGTSMGLSPQQQALLPTSTKAKSTALDFMKKWQVTVQRSGELVKLQGNIMRGLVSKLGLSNVQLINKALLAGKREFGDPIAQQYANAAYTLMTEYARAVSGPASTGQMHEGAVERADRILSESESPAQFNAALDLIDKEVSNAEIVNDQTVTGLQESMEVKAPPSPNDMATLVEQAGWPYEPDKYDYRVENGQVLRKLK